MKKILQGLLASLFGILFALILAEAALRIYLRMAKPAAAWSDRPEFYFKHEAAATLQDFPYNPIKQDNIFRIAVVGDSFTFAPYMQFTDTFPKRLEDMLNLNKVALKAEVINYGVPAYSTSHEVSVAERAVEEDADLIIVQITLNDAELKPYRPKEINPDLPDRFGDKQFTGTMKKVVAYWKSLGFVLERLHNQKTHTAYKDYFIELFEHKRGWEIFKRSFLKIKSAADKGEKRLIAVIFPLFGLPLDDRYPFIELHEKIAAFLKENSIPVLDLYPAYKGIPLDRLQVIPGLDRHPNEIGHRIAAERIYSWLERANFIPADLKIKKRFSERMGITGKGALF